MTACEDYNFQHLWEDVTPNIIYPAYPAKYPARERRCENCGLHEKEHIIQPEIREWKNINETK